ncbi:MAG TPA: class I SAM-dependent methyltransferase [Acidimicrobiales bacterium]|nr:class I SAM-dependent methyltransferase [Acidimicrobiales bacterium]
MVTSGESVTSLVGPYEWGLRRTLSLFRAFRGGQTDFDRFYRTEPQHFYRFQAADSIAQLSRYVPLAGKLVVDVGGGPGYFTEALTRAGARCVLVEPQAGADEELISSSVMPAAGTDSSSAETAARELHRWHIEPGRLALGKTVAGDGHRLPIPDGVADVTFSSNVLEHVPAPDQFIDEMIRVTRPGGLLYVSFTAWYSFWGGHETAPWHFLGGHRAARHYEKRRGQPPSNLYGSSLFACHVGGMLRLVRSHPGIDVVDALPRYHPDWMRWITHVPIVREVATWNLLLVLRRRDPGP